MSMLIRLSLRRATQIEPILWNGFEAYLPSQYNFEDMKDTILSEYGSCGIAFPLVEFPHAMEVWTRRNQYMLQGLMETTLQTYNMVENYDRTQSDRHTLTHEGSGTSTVSSEGKNTGSSSTQEQEPAYDNTTTPSLVNSGTSTTQSSSSGDTKSSTSGSDTYTDIDSTESHIHGNIGVTTAAQMLEAERKLHMFDLYKEVARMFARDLLVGVLFFD